MEGDGRRDVHVSAALRPTLERLERQRGLASSREEEIERQRRRASWQAADDGRGLNPTADACSAGFKWGSLSALVGAGAIGAGHRFSPAVRRISLAGKVWLVSIAAMAGFFVSSEQAVVGTDARERAAAARPT